jgi:hypothetical protein
MAKKKEDDLGFEPEAASSDDGLQFEPEQINSYKGEHAEAVQAYDQGTVPVVQAAGNAVDFLDSPIREGVNETINNASFDLRDPIQHTAQNIKAMGKGIVAGAGRLAENLKRPLTSPSEAPTYQDIIKKQLDESPTASLFLSPKEKDTAAGMTGLAADFVAPSMLAKTAVAIGKTPKVASKLDDYLKRATNSLKNVERKQMTKAMARFETVAQFKNSKIDPDKVAAVLVDNELTPHAGNPAKMYEALTGTKRTNYVEVAPGLSQEVTEKGDGLIAKKSKGMRDEIYEVANDNGIETQVPSFAMKQKIKQRAILEDATGARVSSPQEIAQRQEIVDGLLKPYEEVIVPGVPVEAAQQLEKKAVPPPIPLDQADQFPLNSANEASVEFPDLPPRPTKDQFPLRPADQIPRAKSRDAIIKDAYPPEPKPPQFYGGIVSKDTEEKFFKEYREWEAAKAKIDAAHEAKMLEADKYDQVRESYRVKDAELRSTERLQKYESAVKAWDEEVNTLIKEYQDELKKAKNVDRQVMEAKAEQSAKRFMEKARRNDAYRKEIMEVDNDYAEKVVSALKAKAFNQPRHWSLEDMMNLRTNIGKRLSSAEFHADKPLTLEKEVLENVYHSLKEEISNALRGKKVNIKGTGGQLLDAADYYEIQSNAIRRMLEAEEILKAAVLNEHKQPDVMAKLLGITSAGGVGGSMLAGGHLLGMEPTIPAAIATTAAVAETYRQVKGGAPQLLARGAKALRSGIETAAQHPEEVIKGLGAASRKIRDNYVMPQPGDEGYMPPQTNMIPRQLKSIPEQLIETPLERNSEALVANKRLVLAKFAQQMPELFGMVAQAAKDGDDKFVKVMGFLANQPTIPGQPSARDLFKADKYDTFDGKIMDPQMKMLAMDDTRNNDSLDSIQKAELMNKIQKGERIF